LELTGTIGQATVELIGSVAKPHSASGLASKLRITAGSLADLNVLGLETALPDLKPFSFEADLQQSDGDYQLNNLHVLLGSSVITGNAVLKPKADPSHLSGELQATLIDLTEIGSPKSASTPKNKPRRVFSDQPLSLGALRTMDADLKISIKTLKHPSVTLENLQASLQLTNGKLQVQPSAEIAGGKLAGSLTLDGSGKQASLDQTLTITGLMPAELPRVAEKNLIRGGRTNLTMKLRGNGTSVAQIMAGANGLIRLQMGSGQLTNAGSDLASADLLFKGLRMLNPLSGTDPNTKIECAVIHFPIKNGVASNDTGIALQTDKLNILGGGSIDLRTEKLDIGTKLKPREGLGLNLSSMADFVRPGGTLAEPAAVTDAKGAAVAGIKAGAAVATVGLSVLAEGLFDRSTVDDEVCAVALGERAAKTTKQEATENTENTGKAASSTTEAIKTVGRKASGMLKGLFD